MLNHGYKSTKKRVSEMTVLIELIYILSLGVITVIICSCAWKFFNGWLHLDHTAYGINLIQYCIVKVSRFCEYRWFNVDAWYDILRLVYCIFVYYALPIIITSRFCVFYQSMINECKSGLSKTIGMVIITGVILSVCVFMFLDLLTVMRLIQDSDMAFGYIIGTMTN